MEKIWERRARKQREREQAERASLTAAPLALPAGRSQAAGGGLVPELPKLGTSPATLGLEPIQDRGWISIPWRHKWRLAPWAATLGVFVGAAVNPVGTILTATGLGLAAAAAQRWAPLTILRRAWLSRHERGLIWQWCAGVIPWTTLVALGPWGPFSIVGGAAFVGAVGYQTVSWWRSRRIRKEKKKTVRAGSPQAQAIMNDWPVVVSALGPSSLHGSQIIEIDEQEDTGVTVCVVGLRRGVHAEDAATDEIRKWLESEFKMGRGTARLEIDDDDVTIIRLILTPKRHLEKTSKKWEGPSITRDGRIPVMFSDDGKKGEIQAWGKDGVRHLLVVGAAGSGKSNAFNVALLPPVLAGLEVLIYLDGKRGTSSPEIANAFDMVARTPEEWRAAVMMFYRIMQAREERYAAMGMSTFDAHGPDPIISLVIDEGHTVSNGLGAGVNHLVETIVERGRALGMATKVAVQSANADHIPGGMAARNNLQGTASNVIALRPGGTTAQSLATSGLSGDFDLLSLPSGGGWGLIAVGGQVVLPKGRIPDATVETSDVLARTLDGFVARTLAGGDADAAGETYANRVTGAQWKAEIEANRAAHLRGEPIKIARPVLAELPAPVPSEVDKFITGAAQAQKSLGEVHLLKLRQALTDTPKSKAVLAKEIGVSPSTVKRWMQVLKEEGYAESTQEGYRLAERDEDAAGAA